LPGPVDLRADRFVANRLYEAKLLLVGESGVGKTSLLRRLYQPHLQLPEEKESTMGIEIHRHGFS
jgi:internalin A